MKINLELLAEKFADVEFFIACIFPDATPEFSGEHGGALATLNTPDFWAITSRAPDDGKGLVHEVDGAQIVFRGYESTLSVHSYSEPSALVSLSEPAKLENGAFFYIKFHKYLQQAIVRSDAMGIGPAFYRRSGGAWLFASHPALIHFDGDVPDMTAWAGLLQNGQALGDRSFYANISRVPAGVQMAIERDSSTTVQWFDFAVLPAGTEEIDDEAFNVVENAYRNAFDRCLALNVGDVTLPFSSGFDSRRFFATLLRKNHPFKAVTCQSFHRKNGNDYDIDSFFAPKIAAAFGRDCELLPAVDPNRIEADAARRQGLIGTETLMHAWAIPFMRWLAKRPRSLVFDGLAGDTFGNSGFEIEGLHETPEKDAELLVRENSKPFFLRQLSKVFPTLTQFQQHYRSYLSQFAPNINQAELAFLHSRTRRCISPWITMMHPPGHVVVFPYCDLEFARATLKYHPAGKYKWFFQKECLRRFYPEFFNFAGSRNFPAGHAPIPQALRDARDRANDRFAYGKPSVIFSAFSYLSLPNKILLLLSGIIPGLRRRRDWVFRPLLLLIRTRKEADVFIEHEGSKKSTPARFAAEPSDKEAVERGLA
jgi:hypothetical protein